MEVKSYKNLIVWQKAVDLIEQIYTLSSKLPHAEIYNLTSQIKRASVSIASNIAEGKSRLYKKEYGQFLRISLGSAFELETQLIIINRLYPEIDINMCIILLTEIQKMLSVIIRNIFA